MSNLVERFYDSGGALKAIRAVFEHSQLLRISTAYFEASGYHLLQDVLQGKQVKLLVGREQGAKDRLETVIREFVNSLSIGSQINRTKAMRQMLEALERGELAVQVGDDPTDTTSVIDGRYLYQHAKLYIGDDYAAVVTSANLSNHGLKRSRENGITTTDEKDINYFIDSFEQYFSKASGVTQRFIDEIRAYLNDYEPYIIYARALLELYQLPEAEVPPQLPQLAEYQKPAVTRIKTNIEEHGGAFFVASTGLGKTVMAAHVVAYLRMINLVDSVIIICPAGLKENWRRIMRASKTSSEQFSYHTLSGSDFERDNQLKVLLYELRQATEKTLIIIDESHHMRNDKEDRERNSRIKELVRNNNAKILLLTATPFSKAVKDVNDQLGLLPQPIKNQVTHLGLSVESHSWKIEVSNELSQLPPCFVLTTPTIVKHFGHIDETTGANYIQFKNEKRYFPTRLRLKTVVYKNSCDNFLSGLLDEKLLYGTTQDKVADIQMSLFQIEDYETVGGRNPLFESQIIHQFCSSPAKVEDFCHKVMNNDYKIDFAKQNELEDYINSWETLILQWKNLSEDEKLQETINIIKQNLNEKIVIFCVYHETAKYLKQELVRYFPSISIETTVNKQGEKLDNVLHRFAPIANEVPEDLRKDNIQILIATGAIAEGFNLQDASILINYDLTWTILQLAQRMGRILRPWIEPREINIYNLIPSTMTDVNYIAQNWRRRLSTQSEEYRAFAQIPIVLKETDSDQAWQMTELAHKLVQSFSEVSLDLEQVMEFIDNAESLQTTHFYNDLASIPKEKALEIRKYPPGIRSARSITKGKTKLFILFSYKSKLYPVLFDANGKIISDYENPDKIMKHIRCDESELKAHFQHYPEDDEFDSWIEASKQSWAKRLNISEINRIQWMCALALIRTTS